ncbi:MAG: membrane protein insertase YidC, partial [Bdellovibrionota bacterium]
MKKESVGLAVSLMLLFGAYIFVQNYYLKQQPEVTQTAQAAVQGTPISTVSTVSTEKHELLPLTVANPDDLNLFVPYAHLSFTKKGGCLGKNALTTEQVAYNDSTPVSVISSYNLCKAFGFKVGETDLRTQDAGISKKSQNSVQIVQHTDTLEIIRNISFANDNYIGDFNVEVRNISNQAQQTTVDFELGASSDDKHAGGMFSMVPPQFNGVAVRLADGKVKRENTPFEGSPDRKIILNEIGASPTWLSTESLYWMNTLIPQFHTPIDFVVLRTGFNIMKNSTAEIDQTVYEAWVQHPIHLQAGQSQVFNYKVYFGPKNETTLKQFDQYKLNETIDYGFFKIIARPLYYILDFIHDLVKNWGVAIIVLTIIINIIFMPLQIKGYASAQKMQAIQPQIKALQEKYKDDKQTMHKESMALMSKGGVNPMSGCLPLLPQIPVFFGLNSTLQHTFDLRQSPFFFWIHDLTRPDPYFILPIIMALLMLGYQKMMPMPSMDPTQA